MPKKKIDFEKMPLKSFDEAEMKSMISAFESSSALAPIETFTVVEEDEPDINSTVEDCFNRFISYQKGKGNRSETIRSYQTDFKRMIRFFEATIGEAVDGYPVAVMAHNQFEQWYREWMAKEGMREQTIISTMRGYRAFYYYCAEQGWLPKKKIAIKQTEPPIKPLFTEEQLDKILAKPSSKEFLDIRNYTIVNLCYGIGARIGSIAALKMADLEELNDGYVLLQTTKNRKPQRVYIPAKTIGIFKNYLNTYRSDAGREEAVFCNQFGDFTTANNMSACIRNYMISRLGKNAPAHLGAHSLRHQYAASFIRNGGSIVDLKQQLGHSSLAMSLHYANHYATPNAPEIEKYSPINHRKTKTGRTKKF